VRAARVDSEYVGDADVRARIGATDERRPRTGVRADVGAPTHPELENGAATGLLCYPGGLRSDERLIVEMVEQRCLEQLSEHKGSLDHRNGFVRMDDPSLLHGSDRERTEPLGTLEP